MRCRECDYPLWNLATRTCPECGTNFAPSDQDFAPNQVRFCCQYCDTAYYGTTRRGHLEPPEFDCVKCGRHICMDEMVLRPAEGANESDTIGTSVPWIEPSNGRFKAWFAMIGRSMTAPGDLGRGITSASSVGTAWVYAAITWLVISFFGVGVPLLAIGVLQLLDGRTGEAAGMVAAALGSTIGITGLVLFSLLIWGATIQGLLRITGGCTHGMGRTYQVLCYSSGPNVLVAVPCIGPYCAGYVGSIWQVVSATIMLCPAQNVSGARAALATLTFPVVATLLGFTGYMGLIFMSFTNSRLVGMGLTGDANAAVKAYATSNGVYPTSGLQLLQLDLVTPGDFVAANSETLISDIPIGTESLQEVMFLGTNDRNAAIDAALAREPANVIASRVGDLVFTCGGLDPGVRGLWVVVTCSDPATNSDQAEPVVVGLSDGTTITLSADDFVANLAEQNERRAAAGAPPLPDPRTIRHDAPAVGLPIPPVPLDPVPPDDDDGAAQSRLDPGSRLASAKRVLATGGFGLRESCSGHPDRHRIHSTHLAA